MAKITIIISDLENMELDIKVAVDPSIPNFSDIFKGDPEKGMVIHAQLSPAQQAGFTALTLLKQWMGIANRGLHPHVIPEEES